MSGTGRPAIITRLTLLAAGCVAPGRTLAAPDGVTGFGERVAAVPDLDHDGTTDLAVSTRSGLPLARLFSGATGAPLGDLAGLELPTPWGSHPDAPRVCAVLGADAECAGLVVGAPNRQRDGHFCGWVGMYAPATQRLVWESWGEDEMEVRGVALAPLPDVNGDGLQDVAVGTGECEAEPGQWLSGRVLVLSGGSGAVLGEFRAPAPDFNQDFGITLASLGDVDRDGVPDLAVGATKHPLGRGAGDCVAAVFRLYIASADGLHVRLLFEGRREDGPYGVLAAVPDLDHDGAADIALRLSRRYDQDLAVIGRVLLISSATGDVLVDRAGTLPSKQAGMLMPAELSWEQLESSAPEADFAANVAFVLRGGRRVAFAIGDPDRAMGAGQSGAVLIRRLP